MIDNQFKNIKNAGFTLVEMMVVILIIGMLFALGSWWGLFSRRENARIEELAVNLIGLIDQEKTNTLLGKTEWGEIVRKRKIEISFGNNTINYIAKADLAKDDEGSYNITSYTKSWPLVGLGLNVFPCPYAPSLGSTLTIEFTWDTMQILEPTTLGGATPHLILQIGRNLVYREIHIDRRTGMTFERAGPTPIPACN